MRPLTVKLNGRAEAPDWRRGRTISSRARGAQPPAHHGPFQRWLEDALIETTVRARNLQRKSELPEATNPATLSAATAATGKATGASATGGFPTCPRAHKRKRRAKGLGLGSSNPDPAP
jgi:hypothetical protein